MTNPTPHGQVPEALRIADEFRDCIECDAIPSIIDIEKAADELRRLHAENESLRTTPVQNPAEIEHVAGDVSKNGAEVNMSTQQPAPAAGAVAGQMDHIDAVAMARYKVEPSHDSMFHRFAVVAGDGQQQIYVGRETECQNMARKFSGAFLDGAFYQSQIAAAPTPADNGELNFVTLRQFRVIARAALAKWGSPVVAGEPWGASVGDRVWVGKLPTHVQKLAEEEGLPIQWLYTTPQPAQAQAGAVPLTAEQAQDLIDLESWGPEAISLNAQLLRTIRRTETAHGIKGGQHA